MPENADTSRSVVQVYVPAYQRDIWDEHAEELDMSRSEFVKTMVQSGRRGFGADSVEMGGPQDGQNSGADSLEDEIRECLQHENCLSWDELLQELTDDIETRLESTLQELQEDGTLRYSGRDGGYVLDTEP
jgi:hypothetical protein